jgi:glutamate synthase domain-containing protein 3
VRTAEGQVHCDLSASVKSTSNGDDISVIDQAIYAGDSATLSIYLRSVIQEMDYDRLRSYVGEIFHKTAEKHTALGIETLTSCIDRRYPTGNKKRSSVICALRDGLEKIFASQPLCNGSTDGAYVRITKDTSDLLRAPRNGEKTLLIDATGFEPQGPDCDAALGVRAYELGWKHLIHYNSRGTRFHSAGFGMGTEDLRVDCYDNPGDYLASGMDGLQTYVHGNAQDQVCQIAKSGKFVVYGDVGQTFLYGSKGGDIYVLGNVAGRPMINSVGRPRVVINGTALDFLAESFMAGDPLNGGGFAIVNGLFFDENEEVQPLEMPYPGANLLSLASGGAIYVRDPFNTLVDDQLNNGVFLSLKDEDWKLLLPYLEENERLFGIRIKEDLLTVDGEERSPENVYRKVAPGFDEEVEAELEALGD